jgi:hypothetical protein
MILVYISNATWGVGLILLFIFAGYLYKLLRVRMPEEEEAPVSLEEKSKLKRYALLTILGGLGVVVSANFL